MPGARAPPAPSEPTLRARRAAPKDDDEVDFDDNSDDELEKPIWGDIYEDGEFSLNKLKQAEFKKRKNAQVYGKSSRACLLLF